MILIREAGSIDQSKWDEFVVRSPGSTPYHMFAWGKSIKEAYGHAIYYLIAEEKDTIIGVLPLIYLKPPFLQGELVSIPFSDMGSVLAERHDVQQKLISEAILLGKRLNIKHIEFRQTEPDLTIQNSNFLISKTSSKVRMILNLPGSSEELIKGYKSKMRSQIQKSEKNGLEFKWGGIDDLNSFFYVFSENMKSLGSPVHAKGWFKAILNQFGDKAKIGLVYLGEVPTGVGLILCHNNSVTVPWASTLRKYNHLSPNMLLYWNFLKYAADNGYAQFDFGRSTPGEGTYKFKEQWGAKPVQLHWHYIIMSEKRKKKQTSNSLSRSIVESIWKKIPLAMANIVGPSIRKYISL